MQLVTFKSKFSNTVCVYKSQDVFWSQMQFIPSFKRCTNKAM